MGSQLLIDNFTGNPQEFYALVTEEINERGLPDLEFKWMEEKETDNRPASCINKTA